MKIIFCGGHHNSALLVARVLKQKGYSIFWFGHKYTMIGDKNPGAEYIEVRAEKIPFIEMTPPEIKKALTGDGRADKKGVAKMVSFFLHLNKNQIPKIDDITDALAIAISSSYKNIKLT